MHWGRGGSRESEERCHLPPLPPHTLPPLLLPASFQIIGQQESNNDCLDFFGLLCYYEFGQVLSFFRKLFKLFGCMSLLTRGAWIEILLEGLLFLFPLLSWEGGSIELVSPLSGLSPCCYRHGRSVARHWVSLDACRLDAHRLQTDSLSSILRSISAQKIPRSI